MKKGIKNISGMSKNLSKSIDKSLDHATKAKKLRLSSINIGISISESDELQRLGLSKIHQQDAMVEFARFLLVQGAHLIYGGDLRKDGYTFLFSELAYQYRSKTEQDKKHFTNYFSFPIYLGLNNTHLTDFKKNRVEVVRVAPPAKLVSDTLKIISPDTPENKLIWARSLSKMREEMNKRTSARIFIGGKLLNYSGKYPGIVEEAIMTLNADKPTYLIGGFGGATKAIIDSLSGIQSKQLSDTFQSQSEGYDQFKTMYNSKYPSDRIDYPAMTKFFKTYGIKKLCKNNGLTEAENKRLFITQHIPEMIYYVIQGLNRVF